MYDSVTSMDFKERGKVEDKAIAEFFVEAQLQAFKSEEAGHPIYEDVEKVRIVIPGDRRTEVVERVNQGHKDRWPGQYEAFKKGQDAPAIGTPIEEWPPLTPGTAKTLRFLNIRTVEALAELNDAGIESLGMGARELRDKAKAWLENLRDVRPQLDEAKETIARMEREHEEAIANMRAEMQTQFQEMQADFARRLAESQAIVREAQPTKRPYNRKPKP